MRKRSLTSTKKVSRNLFRGCLTDYLTALSLLNERYRLEIELLNAEYEEKGRTEPPEFFL